MFQKWAAAEILYFHFSPQSWAERWLTDVSLDSKLLCLEGKAVSFLRVYEDKAEVDRPRQLITNSCGAM